MSITLFASNLSKPMKLIRGVSLTTSSINTTPSAEIKKMLRGAQAVCFDVDSTVIREEGIDKLAEYKGVGREVTEWTSSAMNGKTSFRESLTARLNIIKPSKTELQDMLAKHPFQLSDGVTKLIQTLHDQHILVYLVSGGFRQMIEPVASDLHIPSHRIFANNIIFNANGEFEGFDQDEPTSRDGGKSAVISRLKAAHGYESVIMIGDGVTDLEAKPAADAFIGYGGVVERERVKNGADWYVKDFNGITEVLNGN